MDVHGIFEMLDSDPFSSERLLKRLLVEPYRARQPGAHARMRALLSSLVLRREASDPVVLADVAIPAPVWETPQLQMSGAEAVRYHAAYQNVFRVADKELEAMHGAEAIAEKLLRGKAASEADSRLRAANAALAAAVAAANEQAPALSGPVDGRKLVAAYLAVPVFVRLYHDSDATHVRNEADAPDAAQQKVRCFAQNRTPVRLTPCPAGD